MDPQLHRIAMTLATRLTDNPHLARRRDLIRQAELTIRSERRMRRREQLQRAWVSITGPRAGSDGDAVVIRRAGRRDAGAIRHLAARCRRGIPPGPLLVAEAGGQAVVAHSLTTGAAVADPTRTTRDLAALLDLRASQLRACRS